MQTINLGVSPLRCSRLAYGCWRVTGSWDPRDITSEAWAAGKRAIRAAYEAGYTLFDNADIYCAGEAERLLGEVLQEIPGMRDRVLIATKCGIRPPHTPYLSAPQRYDLSAQHILQSCEASLQRLRTDTLDLLLLHRPDYLADPEEVAEAFTRLQQSGKVRYFGLSNCRPTLVTALQCACPMPLVVHQIEISLLHHEPLTDGTLDQCLVEHITPQAWSPLAGGLLADGSSRLLRWQEHYKPEAVRKELDALALQYQTTRSVIALAWLLRHPTGIQPIVGSTQPNRIRDAVRATELELTHDEWYRLLIAARGEPLP
ncbi:MAG: aldo/keto reductase [Verrucomicrobiota bacterium]|nr:aldo/keto reductase [Limisphaera sp.]MDW8381320.1 aldo/keto reductase [Verrucomicrobiota bacterium]